jgi:uncharacterized protein involved in exopolysaccharide biosynthesis
MIVTTTLFGEHKNGFHGFETMNSTKNDNRQFWLDSMLTLLRWRSFLFVNIFAVAIVAVGLSLLLPNWYRGKAVILPPESQHQTLSLGGLVPDIVGAMELPLMASPSDVIGSIASSRAVVDSVIRSQDLMNILGTDNIDLAVEKFRDRLDVKVLENGIIEVSYLDKDPERSATVTNELVKILDHINRDVRKTKANSTRVFIEARLEETEDSLAAAEDALLDFRLSNRAIALDEQTGAQIDMIARLEAERLIAETDLELLERSLTPDHPEVLRLTDKIKGLRDGINRLELGGNPSDSLGLLRQPLIDLPELALELARLMRTVMVHETVFELLTGQYEQARIEESKTTPTLSVLHYSSIPEYKDKPKRSHIVLLATLLAAVISLLWIWLVEHLLAVKQRDPEQFDRLGQLLQGIWLPRFSKRIRNILNES